MIALVPTSCMKARSANQSATFCEARLLRIVKETVYMTTGLRLQYLF